MIMAMKSKTKYSDIDDPGTWPLLKPLDGWAPWGLRWGQESPIDEHFPRYIIVQTVWSNVSRFTQVMIYHDQWISTQCSHSCHHYIVTSTRADHDNNHSDDNPHQNHPEIGSGHCEMFATGESSRSPWSAPWIIIDIMILTMTNHPQIGARRGRTCPTGEAGRSHWGRGTQLLSNGEQIIAVTKLILLSGNNIVVVWNQIIIVIAIIIH